MELLNILQNIGDWFSDKTSATLISLVITFVTGFIARKGWSTIIDNIAKKGKVISKKIERALTEGADVASAAAVLFSEIDEAIKDDGDIDQNSIKEAIQAGKEVIIESKDVVAVFKPKPQ